MRPPFVRPNPRFVAFLFSRSGVLAHHCCQPLRPGALEEVPRRRPKVRRYRYARRHVRSVGDRETGRHRCENGAARGRCTDNFNWRRAAVVDPLEEPEVGAFFRTITLGLAATTVFSLFEVWPRRLPRGHERWILQVVAVGAAMPLTLFVMHRRATSPGAPPFFEDHDWMLVGSAALLVAPWTAVATVVRQKEAFARNQKLMFALERSELERQALDARLHLL